LDAEIEARLGALPDLVEGAVKSQQVGVPFWVATGANLEKEAIHFRLPCGTRSRSASPLAGPASWDPGWTFFPTLL